jgi:hypothetical protein
MPVGVTVEQNGLGDWIAGIANLASGALSLIPHPIPRAIGAAIQVVGKNKLVKTGGMQLIKAAEDAIVSKEALCEKGLICAGATPKEAKAITHSVVNSNSAKTGNYVPVKKKQKRPNRLAELGAKSSMGPDNPWQKTKMKPKGPGGTNM